MGAGCSTCCGGKADLNTAVFWPAIDANSIPGRARDGLYEPVLADSEREAVADLLQYLENVSRVLLA